MKSFLDRFLRMEAAGGILLMLAAVVALFMANSAWLSPAYFAFLDTPFQVRIAELDINKPLLLWINDGLMAVFFLVIGLEVKREMVEGALSSKERALLPVVAAIGGMVVPAAVYLIFNIGDAELAKGWAIPAATDIAFALGVMALLGKRVPASLKVFLLALAIADDLGVIVVIALFYTSEVAIMPLVWSVAATLGLWMLNRRGHGGLSAYMLLGLVLWVAVLKSGVHATLAGVIVGFMIPIKANSGGSPLKKLEHALHPASSFFIVPIFAFANAGVPLAGISLESFQSPLALGVILGLLVGKPLGIYTCSRLAIRAGWAKLPEGANNMQLLATSMLCGIGFTMSIFISSLAFAGQTDLIGLSRLAILAGSVTAALLGYGLLHRSTREEAAKLAELELGQSNKTLSTSSM
ncbi:Na+/H+ antiporter NhaA [Agarivorans sp. 1_MG-2023]|uniref:Na+/H+ antiporter NhaA n=1 Tax=Agarivorans sp. 1_MG-2023 TaxID=3062634 RepID=UPI0026E2F61D|nr:Na+/H+ antiporter NhaA [Agarivorans sp. 1_MG-2023]MDO6763888.1 Na+/H+ antiporter NhaA [Agarivorans sp. 1_MG-2023]